MAPDDQPVIVHEWLKPNFLCCDGRCNSDCSLCSRHRLPISASVHPRPAIAATMASWTRHNRSRDAIFGGTCRDRGSTDSPGPATGVTGKWSRLVLVGWRLQSDALPPRGPTTAQRSGVVRQADSGFVGLGRINHRRPTRNGMETAPIQQ